MNLIEAAMLGFNNGSGSGSFSGEDPNARSSIATHIADTSNPHSVTASQIGLGNVDNTSDTDKPISTAVQTALNDKVDKVTGKDLSTNDFTDALESKLNGIEDNANNYSLPTASNSVLGGVKVDGASIDISDGVISSNYIGKNILINPNFKINQRGNTGTISTVGYFVDRWQLTSGSVTITDNGLALTGTITQTLENSIGVSFVVSTGMYSGTSTITYDDSTQVCTITSDGGIVQWAKLEIGSVATTYHTPDPATELLKCQRYYLGITSGAQFSPYALAAVGSTMLGSCAFPVTMRVSPTIGTISYRNQIRGNGGTWTGFNYLGDVNGISALYNGTLSYSLVEGDYYGIAFSADAEIY